MRSYQILFFALMIFVATLPGCAKGNADHVSKIIGASDIYTSSEIENAMDAVIVHFKNEFEGCILTQITYDEASSKEESAQWAEQYQAQEAIVLISSFDVDSSGGDGGLNPNSTYDGWKWILTRSNAEAWTLQTWGYG